MSIELPKTVQVEFNHLMLGPLIGEGCYRRVYEFALNPDWVVKIETYNTGHFSNAMEWAIWNEIEGTRHAKWFAPCYHISFSGSVLIQARTQKIDRLPSRLPDYMADLKPENFGLFEGRIVAHDYANHHLFGRGFKGSKLKKVA